MTSRTKRRPRSRPKRCERTLAANSNARSTWRAAAMLALTVLAATACDTVPDPIASVDPFIGTGVHGHVYPGATVPHGLVQLSPDNGKSGWDWVAGYHASDSVVVGFSHTHLSGTGIGDLADILFMPGIAPSGGVDITGPWPERTDRPFADRYDHADEAAEPGYYRVRLRESGIDVELTATTRTGVHRYTFPATTPGADPAGAALFVDLGYAVNWDRSVAGELRLVGDTMLVGTRRSTGWASDQTIHFAATFSAPIRLLRLAAGDSNGIEMRPPAARVARRQTVRAILEFDTLDAPLVVRVGVSHTDQDGAILNLSEEAAGRRFDEVRTAASRAWRDELGRVRVAGGTESQRRLFYTSLYRVHLGPVRYDDADGRHAGSPHPPGGAGDAATAGAPDPDRAGSDEGPSSSPRYAIFSLWDTFRAEHPLLTLVSPERQPGIFHSMLGLRQDLGLLPVWELLGSETNTMTGYHAVPVLADLILKGWGEGFEEEALAAMVETADQEGRDIGLYRRHGYVPADSTRESVTKTLEYAYDDATIARVAGHLARRTRDDADEVGDAADGAGDDAVADSLAALADSLAALAARFAARSRAWLEVYDPGTGFMRGKLATGEWRSPFDPVHSSHREDTDYTEGTAWQHSWFVPHDPAGLIRKLGGDAHFIARLDALFAQDTTVTGENVSPDISGMLGQYAQGNEPGHHVPWLYVYAGAPWRTHARVRQILDTLYRDTRDGLPGNEDYGQMSAWYVFAAMGLYPVDPAGGVYVLGSPIFDEIVIEVAGPDRGESASEDRPRRRNFRIEAGGALDNPYVVGARLNGEPWPYTWITHEQITAGGVLELEMAPEPDPAYGRAMEVRPPSLGGDWPVAAVEEAGGG
ncbi:MAG: GH92 family glycosyl hydrolase [Longimicrobiales bacterium]